MPTTPQMRMKRRSDPTLPNDKVYARFGDKSGLITRLRTFCEQHQEFADVLDIIGPAAQHARSGSSRQALPVGYVYLTKFGRHFKIGRTNAVGRRERELAIQLPEKSKTVHVIETDDPPKASKPIGIGGSPRSVETVNGSRSMQPMLRHSSGDGSCSALARVESSDDA